MFIGGQPRAVYMCATFHPTTGAQSRRDKENDVTKKLALFATLATLPAAAVLAQAAQRAAPAAPQTITKAAFLADVDKAFDAVDANKDGVTDKAEIETAQTKSLAARKAALLKEREAAFRQLDKDKNGSLTLVEFNAALQAAALPPANAAPYLGKLDVNKDGKVTKAENRTPAAAEFDSLDTNKDGTLTQAEANARGNQGR